VRRLIAAIAMAMSSSMLAGTAAGNSDRLRGVCKFLEQRVHQCESGTRLSLETRAACDRFERGVRQLCGPLATIVATAAADSAALDLLRQDHQFVAIEDAVFPYDHVVIGPADLDDPHVADLLRKAYRAGKTVAIADATEDEVESFHHLIYPAQAADCISSDRRSGPIELYGLQQSANPPRTGSYCLRNLDARDPASDRRWLRERFGTQVPAQLTPQAVTDDANEQLTSLATGTTCSYKDTDTSVGRIEWTVQAWAMRNFANTPTDYYLVNFNPILTPFVTDVTEYIVDTLQVKEVKGSDSDDIDIDLALIIDTDPQDQTSFVSSYENSSSTTVSGSVGVDGGNIQVSAGGSVTVGNATTTSIPPVTILNQTNTATVEPSWTFKPQSTVANTVYSPMTAWVWQLPEQAYPLGGTGSNQIAFQAQANIFATNANTDFSSTCNVPVPFATWTVPAPMLSGLSCGGSATSCASATHGEQVTVNGLYMYPTVISNVLLGGNAVPTSNLVIGTSSTSFSFFVPGGAVTGSNSLVVETEVSGFGTQASNALTLDITD
jgi:hypothetical protein